MYNILKFHNTAVKHECHNYIGQIRGQSENVNKSYRIFKVY